VPWLNNAPLVTGRDDVGKNAPRVTGRDDVGKNAST